MAALLKKRALAEYTQVLQQEEPTAKKVKCVLKSFVSQSSNSQPAILIGILTSRKTSNEALQLLLRILESPNFNVDEIPYVTKKLTARFQEETESTVRVVILTVLGEFSNVTNTNRQHLKPVVEEVLSLLKKEESHKVLTQGLSTLLKLSRKFPKNDPLFMNLMHQANQFLFDTSPSVKCKCYEVIAELFPIGYESDYVLQKHLLKAVSDNIHNEDARTRTAAFRAMMILHDRGLKLDPSMYSEICIALVDDYDNVREVALKLVWLLGITYPENLRKLPEEEEQIRLIDDAFGRICDCITDLSVRVRQLAAQLLGSMHNVSSKFLEQTLDKKLMSNMRKKRSAHERTWSSVTRGEWAAGKWEDDKPRERLEADEVSLLSSGACGAFVHGLEDEFLEVRSASIDSICALSVARPEFALQSLDFLADMFNDEIEEVRLKAIDSLWKISSHIILREDQLEIILGVLEDSSIDVREGLHRILSSCRLSTKDCLQMCVNSLLDSLNKYAQDRRSVWNCFHKMGSLHATLVLPLIPELLSIHPFFDTAEPNVDDPSYVCVLILVFNAAQQCSTMLQLFEEKTIKHYSYLRDTMPHLVPLLPLNSTLTPTELKPVSTATPAFLNDILERIETAKNTTVRISFLEAAEKDLTRLAEIDFSIAGAARFTALFITNELLLGKILKNRLWSSNVPSEHQSGLVKTQIRELVQNALKMQYLFMGTNNLDVAIIKQSKLKALALALVYVVQATNHSARSLCTYFLAEIDKTKGYLCKENISANSFTCQLFKELSLLEESKPGSVSRTIMPLLRDSSPLSPPKPNKNIKICEAIINSPVSSPDITYKFCAGLAVGVPLDADIYCLMNSKLLRLRIKYPDQQTHLILPRVNHLRYIPAPENGKENTYRLVTTALISHQLWSKSCDVDLSLALDLSEVESTLNHSLLSYNQLCAIDLCKPVKLCIEPKPIRKGI